MNSYLLRVSILFAVLRIGYTAEPWVDWARNPIAVPVTITTTNILALADTPVTVMLSEGVVTQMGLSCSIETNAPPFTVNLNVRREYTLTVMATNLTSLNILYEYHPNWTPTERTGRATQPKSFIFLVDGAVDDSGVISITGNGCASYSNSWTIELTERLPLNVRYEDRTDSANESAGDPAWARLGPGKSLSARQAGIDWSVALGRLMDGQSAGRISLRENEITRSTYLPMELFYSAANEIVRTRVELIPDTPGGAVLRQIKAYQTFVDIVSSSTNATDLKFYLPSQVATNTNSFGIYTSITGNPFVTYTIYNPEPSTTNKLHIKESRNGIFYTNQFTFDPTSTNSTWTLRYGQGTEERIETRGVWLTTGSATNRIEVVTIKSGTSNPTYKATETYKMMPWGFENVEVRVDPDGTIGNGDDLVTTMVFYTDPSNPFTFGKLSSIKYPDGYWEKRTYVESIDPEQFGGENKVYGALDRVYYPWLSNQSDPEAGVAADAVYRNYFYDTSSGRITSDLFMSDNNWINMETFWRDLNPWFYSGEGVEMSNNGLDKTGTATVGGMIGYRGLNPNESWGFGYYGHPFFERWRGKLMESSYYHGGTLDMENNVFTPSGDLIRNGPDWRHSKLFWGVDFADWGDNFITLTSAGGESLYGEFGTVYAYPNRSKHEAEIYHNGNLALKELSVFTGASGPGAPIFDLVCKWAYQSDSLGHTTNIIWIDGSTNSSGVQRTTYSASYQDATGKDGQLKQWEQDETGIKTIYSYDSLKRVSSKTKVGAGGQSDICTQVLYDASDRIITNKMSSGSLSSTEICTYDLAGRVSTVTDTNGLTTTVAYSQGGRIQTKTYPNTTSEVLEKHYDRRTKSRTGTFGVNEYHTWINNNVSLPNFPMDIPILHTIRYAADTSPRYYTEGYDAYNQIAYTEKPDWGGTNLIWETKWFTHYLPGGPTHTGSSMRPDKYAKYMYYDIDGNPYQTYVPTDEGSIGEISTARGETQLRGYVNENGGWLAYATNYVYGTDNSDEKTLRSATTTRLSGFSSGTALSEVTTYDADANGTAVSRQLDLANKKVTETTSSPVSSLSGIRVWINGLLTSTSTLTVSAPETYAYDALGRLTNTISSLGFAKSAQYDSFGRLTSTTDSTGLTIQTDYVPNGSMGAGQVNSTSRNGKKTYYQYSTFGLWRTWGDVPYPSERIYDSYGGLIELRTFRGGTGWGGSSWPASPGTYDSTIFGLDIASGLLTYRTDANSKTSAFTYWQGLLLTQIRARGVAITNEYNDLGEIIATHYNDGTPDVRLTNEVVTSYSRVGKPVFIHDATGDWRIEYSRSGHLTAYVCTNGDFNGITVSNRFDAVHGKDRIYIGGVSTAVDTTYGFDAVGRISSVTSGSATANYSYVPYSDLLSTTTFKNNGITQLTTRRGWDFGTRLRSIANIVGSTAVSSHAYTFDGLNRRKMVTLADNSFWAYDYDDRNEVVSGHRYWSDFTPVSGQQFEYTFNTIGSRVSASFGGDVNGANLRTITYSRNALNQYDSVTTPGFKDILGVSYTANTVTVNGGGTDRKGEYFHAQPSIANTSPIWSTATIVAGTATTIGSFAFPKNTQTYYYDDDGNLIFDGIWTYQWDAANRLVEMVMTNVSGIPNSERKRLMFTYDAQNRRATKKVFLWNGTAFGTNPGTNIRFVYSGGLLQAELNATNNAVIRNYAWGLDLAGKREGVGGIGGLLNAFDGQANYFFAFDGRGNVTTIVKGDGTVAAAYEYGPFGEQIRANGSMANSNPFRYSTKYLDSETGLLYFGRRFYNPSLGRWISRDPAREKGGNNLYAFVENDSLNKVDPDGELMELIGAAAIVAVVILFVVAVYYAAITLVAMDQNGEQMNKSRAHDLDAPEGDGEIQQSWGGQGFNNNLEQFSKDAKEAAQAPGTTISGPPGLPTSKEDAEVAAALEYLKMLNEP